MSVFKNNIVAFKKDQDSIEELVQILQTLSSQGLIQELKGNSSYWIPRFLIGNNIVLSVDRINNGITYFRAVSPDYYYDQSYFYIIENEEELFNSISTELKKVMLFNIDLFF